MDLNTFYMYAGFLMAAYAVVANDSIQTLGTFINSQKNRVPWYVLWVFASTILVGCLTYGWVSNGGDLAFGRLEHIPQPQSYSIFHVAAPALLLVLTRFGIPVSTTFLVLSVFASSEVLEKVLLKSVVGYVFAGIFAYAFWFILSRVIDEHLPIKNENHKRRWRDAQWFATAFLWGSWLMHDLANITVYLPRQTGVEMLIFVLAVLVGGLGVVFYMGGGAIQKIVVNKSGTRYVRSATIIDLVYAFILIVFKQYSNIPMSTSWVFVGLLCGRELAVYRQHKEKHLKTVFPILAKDFFKLVLGLALSVALVMLVSYYK